MDRNAIGFIDDQQMLVFEQNWKFDCWHPRPGAFSRGGRKSHWRHPDSVPFSQTLVDRRSGAVDPNLTAADDPVDQTLGGALEQAQQEVVQALSSMGLIDIDPAHFRRFLSCSRNFLNFSR